MTTRESRSDHHDHHDPAGARHQGGSATTAPSSLVDRVRKLLDKAERTDNPHEAELFSQKAAELVARHRIDPDRLASPPRGELGIVEIPIGRGAYVRARLALVQAVADAHDARVVFQALPTGTVAFVAGFTADLDVVTVMYHSLHQQAASQMAGIRKGTGAATQRFRRSFLFGFADRMAEILADSKQAVESTLTAETRGEVALVLRERRERVDDFAAEQWPRIRSAARPSTVHRDGFVSGAAAADRADVGRARLTGRAAIGRGGR